MRDSGKLKDGGLYGQDSNRVPSEYSFSGLPLHKATRRYSRGKSKKEKSGNPKHRNNDF
jgi:hypothetical protein